MEEQYLRQSELVVRCIPSIAEESCFAIKGGTAINLFETSTLRLSGGSSRPSPPRLRERTANGLWRSPRWKRTPTCSAYLDWRSCQPSSGNAETWKRCAEGTRRSSRTMQWHWEGCFCDKEIGHGSGKVHVSKHWKNGLTGFPVFGSTPRCRFREYLIKYQR